MNTTSNTYIVSFSKIVTDFILSFATFTFCVLATIVLIYFIRRRYHLYWEIRQITIEQLWNPCFQNHLKNLKIKCMITNFVLIILFVEIVNNFLSFFDCFKAWVQYYHLSDFNNKTLYTVIYRVTFISRICYVPILCMVMKVLWLAYLHCPYKYTIKRWTAYIVIRIVAVYIVSVKPICRSACRYLSAYADFVPIFSWFWSMCRFLTDTRQMELNMTKILEFNIRHFLSKFLKKFVEYLWNFVRFRKK